MRSLARSLACGCFVLGALGACASLDGLTADVAGAADGSATDSATESSDAGIANDVTVDADAAVDSAAIEAGTRHFLYALLSVQMGPDPQSWPSEVASIDLDANKVKTVALIGATDLAFSTHGLHATGTTFWTLDPDTLATTASVPLSASFPVMAIAPNGSYAFLGGASVRAVSTTGGQPGGEVTFVAETITGLAIDATGQSLGATLFNGSQAYIGHFLIDALGHVTQSSQPTIGHAAGACNGYNVAPTFVGATLVTFVPDCNAFEAFDPSGATVANLSVSFGSTGGVSFKVGSVTDSQGRAWANNISSLYRVTAGSGAGVGTTLSAGSAGSTLAVAGDRLYALRNDPRTNGLFVIDKADVIAPVTVDLSMLPGPALVRRLIYVVR